MKTILKAALAAAVLGGATAAATPASAANISIGISFGMPGNAIGFSYRSGGYCDRWGCPDTFWDYPISYCPVYYKGIWYSGPMYYRYSRGDYWYWIRGDWHRDNWNGPRPGWACEDRFGPPLGLDFYIWNGFYIRDAWRLNWNKERDDWWRHRQDWDRSNHDDNRWQQWVPQEDRDYDWKRDSQWNADRDWSKQDWNRNDWMQKHDIKKNIDRANLSNVKPAVLPSNTQDNGGKNNMMQGGNKNNMMQNSTGGNTSGGNNSNMMQGGGRDKNNTGGGTTGNTMMNGGRQTTTPADNPPKHETTFDKDKGDKSGPGGDNKTLKARDRGNADKDQNDRGRDKKNDKNPG